MSDSLLTLNAGKGLFRPLLRSDFHCGRIWHTDNSLAFTVKAGHRRLVLIHFLTILHTHTTKKGHSLYIVLQYLVTQFVSHHSCVYESLHYASYLHQVDCPSYFFKFPSFKLIIFLSFPYSCFTFSKVFPTFSPAFPPFPPQRVAPFTPLPFDPRRPATELGAAQHGAVALQAPGDRASDENGQQQPAAEETDDDLVMAVELLGTWSFQL